MTSIITILIDENEEDDTTIVRISKTGDGGSIVEQLAAESISILIRSALSEFASKAKAETKDED